MVTVCVHLEDKAKDKDKAKCNVKDKDKCNVKDKDKCNVKEKDKETNAMSKILLW